MKKLLRFFISLGRAHRCAPAIKNHKEKFFLAIEIFEKGC